MFVVNKSAIKKPSISSNVALELARTSSVDDGLFGGSLTPPSAAHGQVMTYEEAVQFIFNRPIDPNTQTYKTRDKTVWLVVFEGEFIEHVPASADGAIPAKDVTHSQMAIILDANTGENIERILLPPQTKFSLDNLSVLQDTAEEAIPELPTQIPISTEVPLNETLTP